MGSSDCYQGVEVALLLSLYKHELSSVSFKYFQHASRLPSLPISPKLGLRVIAFYGPGEGGR